MHRLRFPFLGYTVVLHWSWLIAVTLITWSLATGYYPGIWPEQPRTIYWLSGLLSTFLLFFSILLHECAHAGVATVHGITINEIMLHIVGGWTMLPRELSTPRLEAIVAIAGPACSAIIGLLLWPLSDFPVAAYIMKFNFILAGYNVVPAFPMDGGRMLRAWLWYRGGSFAQATERAALLGKRIAIGMMVFGAVGLFLQWSTFWLMIGGIILRMVSDGQHHSVEFSHRLTGQVTSIMIPRTHVLCVTEQQTVQQVKDLFLRFGYHHFPVLRDGHVIGHLHYNQLRAHPDWTADHQTPIRELVEPLSREILIPPTATINDAFDQMLLTGSPRLLVYDQGDFLGMLTRESVTRLRELHQKESQWVTLTGGSPQTATHHS
jgi:Zn-dependent protease/CBS domain-containing protein